MLNKRFSLLILLYFALVTTLIVRVPPGAAPDEAAHIDYVKFIAAHHALPVFTGASPPGYGYEFHQPPLYYLLCAPGALLPGDGVFTFCRAISALCGLGVLLFIGAAARRLFPRREDIALLATGVAAVWPLHLSVSASGGNDALAGFWCAALFYLIARGANQSWTTRDALLAGLCAGLGLWTKTTTLPVTLAALGAAWQMARRDALPRPLPEGGENSSPLGGGRVGAARSDAPLTMALTGFVIALPLFARNQMLYGDPLGWTAFSQAATAVAPGYQMFHEQAGMDFVQYTRGLLLILFCTLWGFFGGPDSAVNAVRPLRDSPKPWPAELLPLAAICALATVITVLGALRWRDEKALRGEAVEFVARWWSFGVLLIVLGWAQFAYAHFAGAQARYLHPALLPICVCGAASWSAFLPGRSRSVVALIFALALLTLTLLNIFVWRTLV